VNDVNVERALSINAETPYMVIDLDQTKRNIRKMQEIASKNKKALRPHSKTHKIPYLARLQIEEGAVGVCVQKVAEAEVMFEGGVTDILISNEVVDKRKCDRVAKIASEGGRITVAVDSLIGAKNLSESAAHYGVTIPVLIDVNVGMNRCGVDPENVLSFYRQLKEFPNIKVVGLMAYDGHVIDPNPSKREEMVEAEYKSITNIFKELKKLDENIRILSVGGTPTAEFWAQLDEVTELQPGTYVFCDIHYSELGVCTLEEISMGVVAQVMSMKEGKRIVLDAGYKAVSLDQGVYPIAVNEHGIVGKVVSMSEEHTVIKPEQKSVTIGSKVLLLPYHACTTTDMWDHAWIFEGDKPPIKIPISARGKRE